MAAAKKLYEKYKMLIPVLVLTGCCMLTVFRFFYGWVGKEGSVSYLVLTTKHYGAFAAVILNIISFFAFRRYFKYVFLATLLLGAFCIINFTPSDHKVGMGNIEDGGLALQPMSLMIGLLTLALNFKIVRSAFSIKNDQVEPGEEKRFNKEVEEFKKRYESYSTEDLVQIISDRRYTVAALEAAQQVVDERKNVNL